MRGLAGAIEIEVLLRRYLDYSDDAKALCLLERLHSRYALPTIRKALARKSLDATSEEAITSLAIEHLVCRLEKARSSRQRDAVRHFTAYVTAIAYHAFGEYLDDKYPERRRLKQRIRYALRHEPKMANWHSLDGRTLCGRAEWQAQRRAVLTGDRLDQLRRDPESVAAEALPEYTPSEAPLPLLVFALLTWLGHPIELEALVSAIAQIYGIRTLYDPSGSVQGEGEENGSDVYASAADTRLNPEDAALQKDYLQQMWTEIGRLKNRNQRTCLLLGRIDGAAGNMPDAFANLGIATRSEVANVLEMPWEQFATLWPDLPLDDGRIAALLGISSENVRFQRHSARARLRERLGPAGF